MLPLQIGLPGGPELLIVFLMFVMLPLTGIYVGYKLLQAFRETQTA